MQSQIAVDPTGCMGSFYDAHRDVVKGKLINTLSVITGAVHQDRRCSFCGTDGNESGNILKWMGFSQELRINLYLYPNLQQNIASLLHSPPPIDNQTYFLYIRHVSSTESCTSNKQDLQESFKDVSFDVSATHLITQISWGITALMVLRISSDKDSNYLLRILKIGLSSGKFDAGTNVFKQIELIRVYSNIHDLTTTIKLKDLCDQLNNIRNNRSEHQRVEYGLTPLVDLCSQNMKSQVQYYSLNSHMSNELEKFLLTRWGKLNSLQEKTQNVLASSRQKLAGLSEQIGRARSDLLQHHAQQLEIIRETVLKLRTASYDYPLFDQLLSDKTVEQEMKDLRNILLETENKLEFIDDFKKKGIDYLDVSALSIEESYSSSLVNSILLQKGQYKGILCANDQFRLRNDREWKANYSKLLELKGTDEQSTLLYADFTYSTYKLERILVLSPEPDHPAAEKVVKKVKSEEGVTVKSDAAPINILLLGQSGVGKSTFINAFVNYLRFSSLDDAEKAEPTVVIPVSFVMTDGHNFDEQVIKFGEADLNENHNNEGQSVTEHCKLYNLHLPNGRQLRLIDTAGFGDTRGTEQDRANLIRIFSFVNHLEYLNGICLLFKSNDNELNICFNSYFRQFFDYFGERMLSSLIVCYTNARGTFFAPGETHKLLKEFFEKKSNDVEVLRRENIFCFDSESFRFLVALQNSVKFNLEERSEYGSSWTESRNEASRLYKFLCERQRMDLTQELNTIGRIQYNIDLYRIPILETMKNIVYNLVLLKNGQSIKLHAAPTNSFQQSASNRNQCSRDVCPLLIKISSQESTDSHLRYGPGKTFRYAVDYEWTKNIIQERDDLRSDLEILLKTCVRITHFTQKITHEDQPDRFLLFFEQSIKEIENLYAKTPSEKIYEDAISQWRSIHKAYQDRLQQLKYSKPNVNSDEIVNALEFINGSIKEIIIQVDAIRESQKMLFEENNRIVVIPPCKSDHQFKDSILC